MNFRTPKNEKQNFRNDRFNLIFFCNVSQNMYENQISSFGVSAAQYIEPMNPSCPNPPSIGQKTIIYN